MKWVYRNLIRPLGLFLGMRPVSLRCRWWVENDTLMMDGLGYVRRWATREDTHAEAARTIREAMDEYEAAHGYRPRIDGPVEWNIDWGRLC